jgi:hypothetical protein
VADRLLEHSRVGNLDAWHGQQLLKDVLAVGAAAGHPKRVAGTADVGAGRQTSPDPG